MNKLKKLVLTAAALGALAVGGAAFAQAQNGSSAPAPVQQSGGESAAGDTDSVQSGDTAGQDRSEGASEQGSEAADGPEKADGPESASENEASDANEGPGAHEPNDAGAGHEVEDGN